MGNLVLNKPTTASSYVLPYSSARAVDGSTAPTNRWLCNQLPGYMTVNMGSPCWINRWIVRHMGTAGWKTPDYNMMDYKLQGSNDNTNWVDLDSVIGNTVAVTDRTFTAVQYQYVRLYVTKGIMVNQKLASCMELEVYEAPPTSSNLSALTISTGTLSPTFTPTTFAYTSAVDNTVSSITVTPTSIDGGTIKVNGTAVTSGQPSQAISLNVGVNTIPIVVTSRIGSVVSTYNVTITRQANPWLTGLVVKNTDNTLLATDPTFAPQTMNYNISTDYDLSSTPDAYSITLTPSAEAGTTISINNATMVSGQPSAPIKLNVGDNVISIKVASSNGTVEKDYTVNIIRNSNDNLTNLVLVAARKSVPTNPAFNKYTLSYTADMTQSSSTSVQVTPTAQDTSVVIRVNGTIVASGIPSAAIILSQGQNTITVTVTPQTGTKIRSYVVVVSK